MKSGKEYSATEIINATQQVAGSKDGTMRFAIKVRGQTIQSGDLVPEQVRGGGLEAWCNQVRDTIDQMNAEEVAKKKRARDESLNVSDEAGKSSVSEKTAAPPAPAKGTSPQGMNGLTPTEFVKQQYEIASEQLARAKEAFSVWEREVLRLRQEAQEWQKLREALTPTPDQEQPPSSEAKPKVGRRSRRSKKNG